MFTRLFVRSDALNRQLSAPLADERRHYLANCEEQGMSKTTLRSKARILISIANHLKSAYRPQEQITLRQIGQAARRWARKKRSSPSKPLGEEFVSEAVAWLSFLGRCGLKLNQRGPTTKCWSSENSWKRTVASLR